MNPSAPRYRLLDRFSSAFSGTQYRHRRSNVGNLIALELYEDLFTLAKSMKLVERIEVKQSILNVIGDLTGIVARRADGTFGE